MKYPQGADLGAVHLVAHLTWEGEMSRHTIRYRFMVYGYMRFDVEGVIIGNLVKIGLEKSYVGRPL